MRPELPPLLADWSLRQDVLAALGAANADNNAGAGDIHQALSVALFVTAMACGVVSVALVWRRRARLGAHDGRVVLAVTAALLTLGLLSPPRWSSDAFLFAYYGKIVAVHGANPYALPGRAFARSCALPALPHRAATPGRPCADDSHCPPPSRCLVDPFVPYQSWLEVRAAYGPLALGTFAALYIEALPPEANVWLLRLMAALAFFALVALITRRYGVLAGAAIGWLPLGAVVSANGGHLEVYVGLLLAALIGAVCDPAPNVPPARTDEKAWWLAVLVVGLCAGAIAALKLHLGLLALPALVVVARRAGVGKAVSAALTAAVVVAIGYGFAWTSPHPFGGLADVADVSIRTPLDLVRRGAHALGQSGDLGLARPVFAAFWLVIVAVVLARLWRALDDDGRDDHHATLIATLQVWLATTLLASGIFHPWYALPGLVLLAMALRRDTATAVLGPTQRATLWLAVSAPVVVNGAWLALGPASFATPAVLVPTLLLFVPVLAIGLKATLLASQKRRKG